MTVAERVVPFGRPSKVRLAELQERAEEAEDDLTAHCAEALQFVDAAWPHVSALERMAVEIGPIALRHALALGALLTSYERRHLPDDPQPAAVAA